MRHQDTHLSDEQIVLKLDGELSSGAARAAQSHLDLCWTCRARLQEIEGAVEDFVRMHHQEFDAQLPPIHGRRALLKAHLAQLAAEPRPRSAWAALFPRFVWPVAGLPALGLLTLGLILVASVLYFHRTSPSQAVVVSVPDSRLTPGAAVLENQRAVCAQTNVKNKAVPVALQRKVFEEYGIVRAEPRDYEVDYLITPALGGADDIHNLWPHSYSATVWNAEVKDALEDRLREMVCGGNLDLTEAQQELASNWIAAYKKYFHTDMPLEESHTRHVQ